jgi:hypothetical protein
MKKIFGAGRISNTTREIWIGSTAMIVLTMTLLGIVGWNGGHPNGYYWASIVVLTVSCVLGCMKFRPGTHN